VKVHANLGKCEGYANCVISAPAVFSIDDDNVVIVVDEQPAESQRAGVEEAVRNCPVDALRIEED